MTGKIVSEGLALIGEAWDQVDDALLGVNKACRTAGTVLKAKEQQESLPQLKKRLRQIKGIERQMRMGGEETSLLKGRITTLEELIAKKERSVVRATLKVAKMGASLLGAAKTVTTSLKFASKLIKVPDLMDTLTNAVSSPAKIADTAAAFLEIGTLTILATQESDSPETLAAGQLQCAVKTYKMARGLYKLATNVQKNGITLKSLTS